MRGGTREWHWRNKEIVMDLSKARVLSVKEIEGELFPVYDAGSGQSLGKMSMKKFLEKFG